MRIYQGFEGKKPCIMRFLPRIKLPEVLTKPPDFCKMAKRLEISLRAIARGFESHRLRHKLRPTRAVGLSLSGKWDSKGR